MTTCNECRAALPDRGTCEQLFHALLLLEQEVMADAEAIAGGLGESAHFYAVSTYVLQHPESMRYTAEALAGVRRAISGHLTGRLRLEQLRRQVRQAADGKARILRRPGDAVVRWPVQNWPMTIVDILAGGVPGYVERVTAWATSVVRTLDDAGR
jgi:hypothetical protein